MVIRPMSYEAIPSMWPQVPVVLNFPASGRRGGAARIECYRRVWTDGVSIVGNGKETPLSLNIIDGGMYNPTGPPEHKIDFDKLLLRWVKILLMDKIILHRELKAIEAGELDT